MIEVRQARYFLALADEEHFGRAAEALGMSQPPLSQAILQLERQLKAHLVDRSGRRIKLTETGRVFAAECRRVVAAAQRAQDAATQAEAGMRGTLRLGVVSSALSEPLLSTLHTFRQVRPEVELRITEVDSPEGEQLLQDSQIDVGFIRLASPIRNLRARPWRRDHLVAVLPSGHRFIDSDMTEVPLADLADDQWVWVQRSVSPDYHDELMSACHAAGFTPRVHHFANSITTQVAMVRAGLGVTIVPNVSVEQGEAAATVRPLVNAPELVELSIVARKEGHAPLVREFLRVAGQLRAPSAPTPRT